MEDFTTYYEILEVGESASFEDIRIAYRRMAQEYHPDRVPEHLKKLRRDAEEKLKQINEAWGVLGNAAKRRQYDAELKKIREEDAEDFEPEPPVSPPPPTRQRPQPPPSPPPPRLFVSQTWFDFSGRGPSENLAGKFTVSVTGGGFLQATVESSESWLRLPQDHVAASVPKEIEFHIDSSALQLGRIYSATVSIQSNLGKQDVRVSVSLQLKKEELTTYRRKMLALGFVFGSALGLAIYSAIPDLQTRNAIALVAGSVAIIGATVVGAKMARWGGAIGAFFLAGIAADVVRSLSIPAYAAGAWGTICGAVLYACASPLLNGKYAKKSRALVAVSAGLVALCGLVVIAGMSLSFGATAVVSIPKAASSTDALTPLETGVVATCAEAKGWRNYTPKTQFQSGETICVYAEAVNVNRSGRIDVTFSLQISGPSGTLPTLPPWKCTLNTTDSSCGYWPQLRLPSEIGPGTYVARVAMRNNLTGQRGQAVTNFTVLAVQQSAEGGAAAPPPLKIGLVTTCAEVHGWNEFVPQNEFHRGENVWVYAEPLNVNQNQRIDVTFSVQLVGPAGTLSAFRLTKSVINTAYGYHEYHSGYLRLPSGIQPGTYVAQVKMRDNLTGEIAQTATSFTVPAGMQSYSANGSWTGWISDSQCGVRGADERARECTIKCVEEHGAQYVFVNDSDKKVYLVDPQDKVAAYAGHHVTVEGTPEGDIIKLQSIEMARLNNAGSLAAAVRILKSSSETPVTSSPTEPANQGQAQSEPPPPSSQPQAWLQPIACREERNFRSKQSATPSAIEFQNGTYGEIHIHRLNQAGRRVFYKALAPSDAYVQSTFLTHPWVAADSQDRCLAIFLPGYGTRKAIVKIAQ